MIKNRNNKMHLVWISWLVSRSSLLFGWFDLLIGRFGWLLDNVTASFLSLLASLVSLFAWLLGHFGCLGICLLSLMVASEDSEIQSWKWLLFILNFNQVLTPKAEELRHALFSRLFGNAVRVQTHCATRHLRTSITSKWIANMELFMSAE